MEENFKLNVTINISAHNPCICTCNLFVFNKIIPEMMYCEFQYELKKFSGSVASINWINPQ